VDNIIAKKVIISGMAIEVISDDETWECRNITTKETVFIKNQFLKMLLNLVRQKYYQNLIIKGTADI